MALFIPAGLEGILKAAKGLRILWARLTEQGVFTTILWALDHIVRRINGAPIESVSRITPLIHVGGQYKQRGWKRLQGRGVGAVVNMRIEYDDREAGIAPGKYLYLPVVDDHPPTLEQLERGAHFISECVEQGVGVYIHCASGIGRAPSMAAAYFISTGLTYEEAMNTIASRRPFIRLLSDQVDQLKQFAEQTAAA